MYDLSDAQDQLADVAETLQFFADAKDSYLLHLAAQNARTAMKLLHDWNEIQAPKEKPMPHGDDSRFF